MNKQDSSIGILMVDSFRFNHFPKVIAFAQNALETPHLIQCARITGHEAVPRSGGYQYVQSSSAFKLRSSFMLILSEASKAGLL